MPIGERVGHGQPVGTDHGGHELSERLSPMSQAPRTCSADQPLDVRTPFHESGPMLTATFATTAR